MKLTVIGCSGSFAGPASAASSYLLEATDADGREWKVLFDLGSGAFGPLQSVIDPATLDAVVISHMHPDHYLDLTGLEVFWAYNERRDLPQLPIWAPDGLPQRFRDVMCRRTDVPDGVSTVPFEHRTLQDGMVFQIGPLTIEAAAVNHPVEAYGFRITDGTTVLCYSGDTDTCDNLIALARNCDLFLCEVGYIEGRDDRFPGVHLTGKRAGEVATAAGARSMIATHIPPWTDPAIAMSELEAAYDGPVRLAEPLLSVGLTTLELAR